MKLNKSAFSAMIMGVSMITLAPSQSLSENSIDGANNAEASISVDRKIAVHNFAVRTLGSGNLLSSSGERGGPNNAPVERIASNGFSDGESGEKKATVKTTTRAALVKNPEPERTQRPLGEPTQNPVGILGHTPFVPTDIIKNLDINHYAFPAGGIPNDP